MKNAILLIALMTASLSVKADDNLASEPILGYFAMNNGVVFQVNSGGCTDHNSFKIESQVEPASEVSHILLVRIKPDYCRAYLPMGTTVRFSYEELGIQSHQAFSISNRNGVIHPWFWLDSSHTD